MTARARIDQVVKLLRSVSPNVVEWTGYALDGRWNDWLTVQPESQGPDNSDQDNDNPVLTLQIAAGGLSPTKRDAIYELMIEKMRETPDFHWLGTEYSVPELGSTAIFEAVATFTTDL